MFRLISAITVLLCVTIFYLISLWNLLKTRKFKGKKIESDLPPPRDALFGISAFLTLIFWLTVVVYPFLVFFNVLDRVGSILLDFSFLSAPIFGWFGLTLLISGLLLFTWSVIARKRYATSWEMPENHKLVTKGPYSLVRHPSYLSYFIMFFGLFLLWPNILTALTIFAIPGYVKITGYEEEMLIKRFRDEYRNYQRKVGKFLPRIRGVKNTNK